MNLTSKTVASLAYLPSAQDKKRSLTRRETPAEKVARTTRATTRKIRNLSGWNVYQKEQLAGLQLLPGDYKQRVTEISAQWRALSEEDREAYHVQAAHEQGLRDKLGQTPLIPKSEKQNSNEGLQEPVDLEQQVGRAGCKKLSARRLSLNMVSHKEHPAWASPTHFADSDLSVLHMKSKNIPIHALTK